MDINHTLALGEHRAPEREGTNMESNERYYRRRAFEERVAAQRAMSEQAKAWHAKLAEDFASRVQTQTAALSA